MGLHYPLILLLSSWRLLGIGPISFFFIIFSCLFPFDRAFVRNPDAFFFSCNILSSFFGGFFFRFYSEPINLRCMGIFVSDRELWI